MSLLSKNTRVYLQKKANSKDKKQTVCKCPTYSEGGEIYFVYVIEFLSALKHNNM